MVYPTGGRDGGNGGNGGEATEYGVRSTYIQAPQADREAKLEKARPRTAGGCAREVVCATVYFVACLKYSLQVYSVVRRYNESSFVSPRNIT